jgi:hypothetical protein
MKLKSLLMAFGFIASSCANTSFPFRFDRVFPLTSGCGLDADENVFTSWGYLDVAAGSPQFFVGVAISGAEKVLQQEIVVGAATLERTDRNRPLIREQVLTYRLSKRVGGTPRQYVLNRTASFNSDGAVIMPVQLISPDLGIQLDALTPSNEFEDFVDIEVDIEFRGEFSATGHPFTTGVYTYPIRAFRSAPPTTCMNGFVKFATDPTTATPDPCSYVGQGYGQNLVPAPPSVCCTQAGPAGGAGC